MFFWRKMKFAKINKQELNFTWVLGSMIGESSKTVGLMPGGIMRGGDRAAGDAKSLEHLKRGVLIMEASKPNLAALLSAMLPLFILVESMPSMEEKMTQTSMEVAAAAILGRTPDFWSLRFEGGAETDRLVGNNVLWRCFLPSQFSFSGKGGSVDFNLKPKEGREETPRGKRYIRKSGERI